MEWNAILRKCVRNISTLLFTSEGSVSSRSASMVVVAKGIVSKQNTMATAYIFIKTEEGHNIEHINFFPGKKLVKQKQRTMT